MYERGGCNPQNPPPLDPPRAVMCVMVSIILCRTTLKLTCMLDHMVAMLPEVILADVSQEIKPVC